MLDIMLDMRGLPRRPGCYGIANTVRTGQLWEITVRPQVANVRRRGAPPQAQQHLAIHERSPPKERVFGGIFGGAIPRADSGWSSAASFGGTAD